MYKNYLFLLSFYFMFYLSTSQNPSSSPLDLCLRKDSYDRSVRNKIKATITENTNNSCFNVNTGYEVLQNDPLCSKEGSYQEMRGSANETKFSNTKAWFDNEDKSTQPSISLYIDPSLVLCHTEKSSSKSGTFFNKNCNKRTTIQKKAVTSRRYTQKCKTSFIETSSEKPTSKSDSGSRKNIHRICDSIYYINSDYDVPRITGTRISIYSTKHCSFKYIYNGILNTVWCVFYGHYIEDLTSKIRFHIQYDDRLCFLKNTISHPQDVKALSKEVLKSIRIICQSCNKLYRKESRADNSNTKGAITSKIANIIQWRGSCPTITYQEMERLEEENQQYISIFLYNYPIFVRRKKNSIIFYFTKLQNSVQVGNDYVSYTHSEMMNYLMENVDMFFRIIEIQPFAFLSLVRFDIPTILTNQLSIFFDSNLSAKLLLFPELLSLRQYTYVINEKNKHYNSHKLYISYYAMCRFEEFVQIFIKHIQRKGLTVNNLRGNDVLFFKMYTREFFLVYIYLHILELNYPNIVVLLSLCRLQFIFFTKLSNNENYVEKGNFIEFLLLNFVDVYFIFDVESFIKNEGIVFDSNSTIKIEQILNQVISKYFYYQYFVQNEFLRQFLESVRIIMPIYEHYENFFEMIFSDANRSDFSWYSHGIISNWINYVQISLIQSYSSGR